MLGVPAKDGAGDPAIGATDTALEWSLILEARLNAEQYGSPNCVPGRREAGNKRGMPNVSWNVRQRCVID